MVELTLESLAARLAEVERQLAAQPGVVPPRTPGDDEFAERMAAQMQATRDAQRRVAELTDVPELADNPMWGRFLDAMRDNRERMDREDAERVAAEDAAFASGMIPPTRDWQGVVGMFEDSDFSRQVDAEVEAARAAERRPGDAETGA